MSDKDLHGSANLREQERQIRGAPGLRVAGRWGYV